MNMGYVAGKSAIIDVYCAPCETLQITSVATINTFEYVVDTGIRTSGAG
jgi:hypothetical protein